MEGQMRGIKLLKRELLLKYFLYFSLVLLSVCIIFPIACFAKKKYILQWKVEKSGERIEVDVYNRRKTVTLMGNWEGNAVIKEDGYGGQIITECQSSAYHWREWIEEVWGECYYTNDPFHRWTKDSLTWTPAEALGETIKCCIYIHINEWEGTMNDPLDGVTWLRIRGHYSTWQKSWGTNKWCKVVDHYSERDYYGMSRFTLLYSLPGQLHKVQDDPPIYEGGWDSDEIHWEISVKVEEEEECEIKEEISPYKQCNALWGSKPYDNTSSTICRKGCYLTTLSMALSGKNINKNPGELNDFMVDNPGCYTDSGGVIPETTVHKVSNGVYRFYYEMHDTVTNKQAAINFLEEYVCKKGYPVVIAVTSPTSGNYPGHFVLVTRKNDSEQWGILDPGPSRETLNEYNNKFQTRGLILSTSQSEGMLIQLISNLSSISMTADDIVNIYVCNQSGYCTGMDSETGQVKEEILQSYYIEDRIADLIDESGDCIGTNTVYVYQPIQDIYQVLLTGLRLGLYNLSIVIYGSDGKFKHTSIIKGLTSEGSISSFEIQFDPAPGTPTFTTRVATFKSTLEDIENSFKLNQIDNKGIVNSLKKKIENAADAVDRGNIEAAKNILNAFKNEVEAQKSKHISEIAAQILLEDADYLINRLQ